MSGRFDGLFYNVASQSGGIEPLLTEFFSFLHRCTDFYIVDENPRRPSGFAPGVAERLVMNSFRRFPFKPKKAPVRDEASPAAPEPRSARVTSRDECDLAEAAHDEGVAADGSRGGGGGDGDDVGGGDTLAAVPTTELPSTVDVPRVRLTEKQKQVPVGNGGVGPGYAWTQSLTDVTVYVAVPPGTRTRDVKWRLDASTIDVHLGATALLCGDLGGDVKPSESMWSLESSTLTVMLEKAVHTWWSCVVVGHPEIDNQMVDSTCKVEDYDDETQAAIRKIMFEQAQKAKGIPTSEELEMARLMEEARRAPGGPV